ncbi:MAG: nucleoside triphosphate pyrophosphohydrolase [Thiohalobacterales bacterium]|nr:nucleoside triphosphate pyrophosphohydrolase [Thiohalobacterales bacterium]
MSAGGTKTVSIDTLLSIMARLRDPAGGCPWDLEQDFGSIAPYTLEEAYEVVDAIDSNDAVALQEELGDLLFQVVFHTQLAREIGWFGFDDVVAGICDKMVRRHPHVFADATVADATAQTREWERHKRREKGGQQGLLTGVTPGLPALMRADKLQRKAAGAGFDWPDIGGVFAKVEEELDELRAELDGTSDPQALLDECGDLLFAAANLVRHAGIDPEAALRHGNSKFVRRFEQVEALCRAAGQDVSTTDADTLDRYWESVKAGVGPVEFPDGD